MQARMNRRRLALVFDALEARLLRDILSQIIQNYQLKPEQLDAKSALAWYSTSGCERAKMSAEETREWLQNLHQYKSQNVAQLLGWCHRLAPGKAAGQLRLSMTVEQAGIFLTALNDHRLFLAARHDIGQEEMDASPAVFLTKLPLAQRVALSEIHFLAWIIQKILEFLPGHPGGWMEEMGGG